jgi:2-hydroxycyclohexanecarboxyl-CoA dehydrogenase
MKLKGKTAFISGGGGGIGGALAQAFAKEGTSVAVSDFDLDRARSIADAIGDITKTCAIRLDVTKPDEWTRARAAVERELGPVDILCSNAGVGYTAPLDEISDAAFRWVHEVNLLASVRAFRTFLPGMKRRGNGGHVLLTCSTTSFRPYVGQGAYSTSKAALLSMALTLEMELAGTGIGVSALCPGMVSTNLGANAQKARPKSLAADNQASRSGSPLEEGMAAKFVAQAAVTAIHKNRFYILTHADYRDAILSEQQLVLAAMEKSADPDHVEPAVLTGKMREHDHAPDGD